ncbi:MAG: EAL domain-containing protein, partial [Spirochaetia bacterium]|nr:EAL domain-containing protein [Spirochaetia bacterium]
GNFDPRRLTFEVLENVQIFECSQALTTIKALKSLGARIAIDDFGTVYSNLSTLLVMEVDAIKIDGLFVKNILRDERSARIVESITRMARESGIKTVAEFVENAGIEEKIRSLGIDYSQGYHIHRPEPMTEVFPKRNAPH